MEFMNFLIMNRLFFCFFLFTFFIIGCARDNIEASHYATDKTENDWITYLSELKYNVTSLQNHVILVMYPTGCSSCTSELKWWNTVGNKELDAKIIVVVIERHESAFNSFVEIHELSIPAFRDENALAIESELVPMTPIKIYFDKDGKIIRQMSMGTGNLSNFLQEISLK